MGYAAPVNARPGFSWGRYPSGGVHRALDYPVPYGTRVQSAMDGTVTVAGWSATGFGWQVRVRYSNGNTGIYAHLSKISVRVGQRVSKRQTIGYSGNSGNSSGPHLHWEIRKYSWVPLSAFNFTEWIDPYTAPTAPTSPYFNRNLLKVKLRNSEVEKFQRWLWSKQPLEYKRWFNENVYNFTTKGFTTYYGNATAHLVRSQYKRLNEKYPNGGWDKGWVGGLPPSEPGPGLFRHFGARSN